MKIGFLVSGRGSNMQAIIQACESGELDARPVVVISNNPNAIALKTALIHEIPAIHLGTSNYPDADELDNKITETMLQHEVELVILAGYMKKVGPRLLATYPDKILNIHPSLLPAFGGKGMFGIHVHEAVLSAGVTETGVTIHLVNENYDEGQILAQKKVPVLPDDTAEILAQRVLLEEHKLYVAVIRDMINKYS